MKALFSIYVLFFVLLPTFSFAVRDNSKDLETGVFRKEFLCWDKLVHDSYFAPAGAKRKYSFPMALVAPEKLISIEEPIGDGTKVHVDFFLADGAFSYAINQSMETIKYDFLLSSSEEKRYIKFERSTSKNSKGSYAFPSEFSSEGGDIKLSNIVDGSTRKKLLEAIGERIQNVKSTFDARMKMYANELKEGFGQRLPYPGREEEIHKQDIMKKPDPLDYKKVLETCRDAFGSDSKFKTLKELIDSELKKFPAPELDRSGSKPNTAT